MDRKLLHRRSSMPHNCLTRRPNMKRNTTVPTSLETTETLFGISRNHNREFDNCACEPILQEITTSLQGMVTIARRDDETTRNCAKNEHLKLPDLTDPTKLICRRESLPNNFGLSRKLPMNSKSQCEAYRECTAITRCKTKSKALQHFLENAEENYDSHKEKAILLHNWMLRQRSSSE